MTLLQSDAFKFLWEASSKDVRSKLMFQIDNLNIEWIRKWMRDHPSQDIGELSYNVLRDRAHTLRISNWSRMNKVELITALRRKLDDENTNGHSHS